MIAQELKNDKIVLYNVFKWLILATLAGVLTGAFIRLFLFLLEKGIDFVTALPDWRYALIPVGLFASLYVVKIFAPSAEGHGTDKVIFAIHYRASRIPFAVVPVKILSTLATLATGGVVGTEGPSVQIGAGLMSEAALLFRFTERERKKLVICGTAAALSAVFGAPIAGAVFGVEVLFVGEFFYPILLPAVISSVAAYFTCVQLGMVYAVPQIAVPELGIPVLLWTFAAALFFSVVCVLHIEIVEGIGNYAKKLKLPDWVKTLIASGVLLTVAAFSGDTYLRTGEIGLNKILAGENVLWCAFALKSFLLAVTLAGGGSGGVLTPTFYIGAAAGALFASVFGLDVGFFGALGFVACVAGAVNTPMAATFLAVGLFGEAIAPYAGIVCVLTYMLVGARSLYPTQILVHPKSDAFVLAEPTDKHSWKVRPVSFRKRKTKRRFFKSNR
ncbi:MAG: chloride channel protein [Acetobacter sp.]|nr:chloride channel protein [Acetobacter sp.]